MQDLDLPTRDNTFEPRVPVFEKVPAEQKKTEFERGVRQLIQLS
jgi:hypothetical protein